MSFLKITDPKKRDEIVQEYLKTRKNIQKQQLSERLGDEESLTELTKHFKPITDAQKHLEDQIVKEIKPIKESIQRFPDALTFPQLPALMNDDEESDDEESDDESVQTIGKIAAKYLKKYYSKDGTDKTYGITSKNNNFYIGDRRLGVINNNIIIDGKEYKGTPGLWELLVMNVPKDENYTGDDYEKYAEIMIKTNALTKSGKAGDHRPKASRGWKWKYLLSTIWNNRDRYEGEGINSTIILPSDPNTLLDRLDLLLAGMVAGNTGVRNEIVSISDELKRQNVIDISKYKELMSFIN